MIASPLTTLPSRKQRGNPINLTIDQTAKLADAYLDTIADRFHK